MLLNLASHLLLLLRNMEFYNGLNLIIIKKIDEFFFQKKSIELTNLVYEYKRQLEKVYDSDRSDIDKRFLKKNSYYFKKINFC